MKEAFVQNPLKVQGYLIGARVSRNRNIYLPELLQKIPEHIAGAPIYWEHVAADRSIGRVVDARYDALRMDVFYEAEIYDDDAVERIKSGLLSHVSLAGDYEVFETPLGYDLIVDIVNPSSLEVSLVAVPGIPQSSIAISEKLGSRRIVEHSKILLTQTGPSKGGSGVSSQLHAGKEKGENMSKEKIERNEEQAIDGQTNQSMNKVLETFREQLQTYNNGMQALIQQNQKLVESLQRTDRARVSKIEEELGKKDSVQEKKKHERVWNALRRVSEAIDATAAANELGQLWQPDMLVLPPGLSANLRQYAEVVEIPRGADRVHFFRINVPTFDNLSPPTVPSDVSHTMTRVTATPSVRGAKQRVTYDVIESSTPDIVESIERGFQMRGVLDEDVQILTALDGATGLAATLYGDESVGAEANVTSAMTFASARLRNAREKIASQGYDVSPGNLLCVLDPIQYRALLAESNIAQAMQFGNPNAIQQGGPVRLFGIDIVESTEVPTGTGSGSITTYHAFVYAKNSISTGLGISRNLLIETERRLEEQSMYIVASHRIAAAVKAPSSVVKIITA